MSCTKCGNKLDDDDCFCVKCGAAVNGTPQPQQAPEPEAPAPEAPKAKVTEGSPDLNTVKTGEKKAIFKRKRNKIIAILVGIVLFVVLVYVAIQGYNGLTHKGRLAESAQEAFIDLLKQEGVNMDRYDIVDITLEEAPVMADRFYIANLSIKAPNGNVEDGKFLVLDQDPLSFWSFVPEFDATATVTIDVETLPASLKAEVTQIREQKRRAERDAFLRRAFEFGQRYKW